MNNARPLRPVAFFFLGSGAASSAVTASSRVNFSASKLAALLTVAVLSPTTSWTTAILVATSTALVGPTLFFGLLIANLAYWFTGSQRHRWTLPASVMAGVICLVGGQLLLEHVFASSLPLALVIELAGGLLFIALLMRGVRQ